jgi:hypothetical protein
MEVVCSSVALMSIYKTVWFHEPEDLNLSL